MYDEYTKQSVIGDIDNVINELEVYRYLLQNLRDDKKDSEIFKFLVWQIIDIFCEISIFDFSEKLNKTIKWV